MELEVSSVVGGCNDARRCVKIKHVPMDISKVDAKHVDVRVRPLHTHLVSHESLATLRRL